MELIAFLTIREIVQQELLSPVITSVRTRATFTSYRVLVLQLLALQSLFTSW